MLVGVAFLPLIPALQNITILHFKKGKLPKHLQHSVCRNLGYPMRICVFLEDTHFLHLQFFSLTQKLQTRPKFWLSVISIFVNLPCYSHEMKGSLPPFYFVDFKAYKIFTYLHQFKAFTKELFFFKKN